MASARMLWGLLPWALLACKGGPALPTDDSAAIDSRAHTADTTSDWPEDTDPPADDSEDSEQPSDADGDGHEAELDCDDSDASVYPGAEELFNGTDDDCDGTIDAVGSWSGEVALSASATYEGKKYNFSMDCPIENERELLDTHFTVTCSPDPKDEMAMLLLGSSFTITPEDSYLWDLELWEGVAVVSSSNGWDSRGDGELRWTSMKRANFTFKLSATWLSMSASGTLSPD